MTHYSPAVDAVIYRGAAWHDLPRAELPMLVVALMDQNGVWPREYATLFAEAEQAGVEVEKAYRETRRVECESRGVTA